ncbi:hypothetical protein DFA_01388 [Cavenderia fasciculata]|uniref:MACPF domain-containing protein n=1 Tax=Cavenderia fasciculata TaxID=261658 RepID=F4PSH2_CACFS|nr:uncharacterized protein DFA_01388 [Cavenderia fasciculata]EGG21502.1 hypothetical protein DFA_01388 [Cavenderia fasciculata]|eukprot:XP_004359352.1 hypothetical protein DFA_01388 [Cavenderia fasciculata]
MEVSSPSNALCPVDASTYYVDPVSTCTKNCGSKSSPFKFIGDAVQYAFRQPCSWNSYHTVMVKSGTFKTNKNKEILIDQNIEIRSMYGSKQTTIDCEGTTFAFRVSEARQFTLQGFTIKNCTTNLGGALYVENTAAVIKDVQFINNTAQIGGAFFSLGQMVTMNSVQFINNRAREMGGGFYAMSSKVNVYNTTFKCNNVGISAQQRNDVGSLKSTISIGDTLTNVTGVGFSCDTASTVTQKGGPSLCDNPATHCSNVTFLPGGCLANPGMPPNVCGDSICNPVYESVFNCPEDCPSAYFTGIVLDSYVIDNKKCSLANISNACLVSTDVLPRLQITDFMRTTNRVVAGKVRTYFKIQKNGYYSFQVTGANIGVKISIDKFPIVDSWFMQSTINSSDYFYLDSNAVHYIEATFFSSSTSTRSLSLVWTDMDGKSDPFEIFYSRLNCGDGILELEEKNKTSKYYCPQDFKSSLAPAVEPVCGDGICNEVNPNTCFVDCFGEMTELCPTRQTSKKHLSPGYPLASDTLGLLIANQQLWRMPGSEVMGFGVDIVTGLGAPSPLFYFGNCQGDATHLVQDPYRNMVYELPTGLNGKPLPQCQYSTESQVFKSTTELSTAMEQESSSSFSATIGAEFKGIGASASVAFTNEKSVSQSNSLATSNEDKIIVTSLNCTTSVIEMTVDKAEDYEFHPVFLNALAKVRTLEDMYQVIVAYGTHFYLRATFGGQLKQLTVTSKMTSSSESENEWKESASRTFGGTVSVPIFSASASKSDTTDSTLSTESQTEMEEGSIHSNIISYGGPMGSYGPSADFSTTEFTYWTQGVDQLPVPIHYDLAPIAYLLKTHHHQWKTSNNKSISELWEKAEALYYARHTRKNNLGNDNSHHYTLILYNSFGKWQTNPSVIPKLHIEWMSNTTGTPTYRSGSVEIFHINVYQNESSPEYVMNMNPDRKKSHEWSIKPFYDHDGSEAPPLLPEIQTKSFNFYDHLASPYRFDFKFANIFSNLTLGHPNITFSGFDGEYWEVNGVIISHTTNEAVTVPHHPSNHVNPGEYLSVIAYEKLFGPYFSKISAGPFSIFKYLNSSAKDCLSEYKCYGRNDTIRFGFAQFDVDLLTGYPTSYGFQPAMEKKTYFGQGAKSEYYNWDAFRGSYQPVKDKVGFGLYMDQINFIGTQARLNWAIYINRTHSDLDFRRQVSVYHTLDEPKLDVRYQYSNSLLTYISTLTLPIGEDGYDDALDDLDLGRFHKLRPFHVDFLDTTYFPNWKFTPSPELSGAHNFTQSTL